MDDARLLACLDADTTRLAAAVGDLDVAVPTCPGWTVRDAVEHTGVVFTHKTACLRLGRRPDEGEFATRPGAGEDLVSWLQAVYAEIRGELTAREPTDAAYTWWPGEQTVHFWYRRMAHEVAVHRVDVESAYGEPGPVAADLAVDGVDEFMQRFLFAPWVEPLSFAPPRVVRVATGGRGWVARMDATGGAVEDAGAAGTEWADATDAVVSGEPSDVELWLWGRLPDARVRIDGDAGAIADFRRWCYAAGQ